MPIATPQRQPMVAGRCSTLEKGSASLDDREQLYTNRGLMACLRDGVPVGVLVQRSPKPNVQYRVLGLAAVTDWTDGFFTLSSRPPEIIGTLQTTASGLAASVAPSGPSYWAFLANPNTFDVERAVEEVEFNTGRSSITTCVLVTAP